MLHICAVCPHPQECGVVEGHCARQASQAQIDAHSFAVDMAVTYSAVASQGYGEPLYNQVETWNPLGNYRKPL